MKVLARPGAALAVLAIVCGLTACGGGGGGGAWLPFAGMPPAASTGNDLPPLPPDPSDDPGNPPSNGGIEPIVPSIAVANLCAVPRAGIDPTTGLPYRDRLGSFTFEKNWVRAWIDETYLWFDEVPTTLAARDYATPIAYFDVLKTPVVTDSGRPKDRFHFTQDTAAYNGLASGGVEVGYGAEFAFLSATPPRDVRVAYTEPGSQAEAQGLVRGDRLLAVDGVDMVDGTDVDTLNAGLAPAQQDEQHVFLFRAKDDTEYTVTLTAAGVTRHPVQNVKTIPTSHGLAGYLQFNDHIATAEAELIAAFDWLKSRQAGQGVDHLVLDLRYNGGGLVHIASRLATMISEGTATAGKTFERLQTNSKNPFNWPGGAIDMPFYTTQSGTYAPPLPRLGLSHITVLAGPDTCSASEALVNGLRGVDIGVTLVGGTTCGKPYGFIPTDNCGTTYFAIQFEGLNHRGEADYGDGMAPTCEVADDFDHILGDPQEARLAAALHMIEGNACPVAMPSAKGDAALRRKAEAAGTPYLVRPPHRENRLLTLPGLPGDGT